MPVVKILPERFVKLVGSQRQKIIDRLPYLGLDIESVEEDAIRVEYNPNRPDFSTDYGIARALRGLMGIETGMPKYTIRSGRIQVYANRNLASVRPFIACAVARNLRLDDESVRQIISMQEDLHNGMGRKRRRVSIGLHNLDVIKPPVYYEGRPTSFTFVPLGESRALRLDEILKETETGREYGHIISGSRLYPILRDSNGVVLSFPPIINGVATKVDTSTKNLFIDVTSTDEAAGEDSLAVIVSTLADAGADLESVRISHSGRNRTTPDLKPWKMHLDAELVRKMIGIDAPDSQIRTYLRRCRLDVAASKQVLIPRYRIDILHPVDIAEEVAIGYGLDKVTPLYPASYDPGKFDSSVVSLNKLSQVMVRCGFAETVNYELVDEASLYTNFARTGDSRVEVENPRSLEHCLLRDSILPSLMGVLARNIKEEYPQRIFEVGRVYRMSAGRIAEASHLCAVVAHASATFSEAKMYLAALVRERVGSEVSTRAGTHWAFAKGRCAEVLLSGRSLGHVGEVKPSALAAFGLGVPISGFEIDLTELISTNG